MILTLGTQDREALIAHRRHGGRFPLRLARQKESQELWIDYLSNGFKIHPPALEPNEVIQIQFVAAWAPESGPELSTWFAVELSPGDLIGNEEPSGGPSRI